MYSNVKKLDWDTNFFQFEIGEINTIPENLNCNNFKLIVYKNQFNTLNNLIGYNINFEELKIIYSKNIKKVNFFKMEQALIRNNLENPRDNNYFYDLAFESGKYSRFKLDSNFSQEHFEKLYKKWVDNSNEDKDNNIIFYIESNITAIGFLILKIVDKNAQVVLISIHRDFQGKGYGKKLLLYAENYCFENNITNLDISTQNKNTNACLFYEAMGYSIFKRTYIKHFWKDDTIQ
jgi:dTDP-4-amino-4,6-dideoxy-D-galactose acyltransferase